MDCDHIEWLANKVILLLFRGIQPGGLDALSQGDYFGGTWLGFGNSLKTPNSLKVVIVSTGQATCFQSLANGERIALADGVGHQERTC